jgi:esterase/lipase
MRLLFQPGRCLVLLWVIIASSCVTAPTPGTPAVVTAIPSSPTSVSHAVSFTTPDGTPMGGIFYGSGTTAVIFSVMGDCRQGWDAIANLIAENHMMALTYRWHGCKESGTAVEDELKQFVDDLRGAIRFMRDQGAEKIILAGASLGGCASAKLTAESGASGLVVIASPSDIPQWGFKIEAEDVNTDIPKLFITAENDDTVDPAKTRALFDLAIEPKEWQTYPGTAHGTDLFETENADELQTRILNFILEIAR